MSEHAGDAPLPPLWRRITGSTWFHLIAAFVVVGALLSFVAKPYWVPSGSMEQTLQVGDRVLVNRLAYIGDAHPGDGDVIVFDADETWGPHASDDENPLKTVLRRLGEVSGFGPSGEHTLIKRVIAGPGQTVSCCDAEGRMLVDGEPVDEPYVFADFPFEPGALDCETTPSSMRCLPEVTVPEGAYLVLGDHRANSADGAYPCRGRVDPDPGCWRWAHDDDVVGRAVVILFPFDRWSGL
ncbi:signal peptidase I [Microbacterium sp. KUDC0406]|uniref:signal peptidase I n=1 Tax=Microbacterium sp. KUDC0406 TaxID=2909588 RepID=UPI001F3B8AC0|nr:signal peptidase I [Microbacterium sp. KUDC0406]UJP08872.1 signal peptidase I [Microbacterium sp. KUDC0406]